MTDLDVDEFEKALEETEESRVVVGSHFEFSPAWIFSQEAKKIIASTTDFLLERYSSRASYVIAKAWAERFTEIMDSLKERAIAGSEKEIILDGKLVATVVEKHARKIYQYEDRELDALNAELTATKEKIKAREKFLQSIPAEEVANTQTGEIIKPALLVSAGATIAVSYV